MLCRYAWSTRPTPMRGSACWGWRWACPPPASSWRRSSLPGPPRGSAPPAGSPCAGRLGAAAAAAGLSFTTTPMMVAAFVLGLTTQGAKIATDTVVQAQVDDGYPRPGLLALRRRVQRGVRRRRGGRRTGAARRTDAPPGWCRGAGADLSRPPRSGVLRERDVSWRGTSTQRRAPAAECTREASSAGRCSTWNMPRSGGLSLPAHHSCRAAVAASSPSGPVLQPQLQQVLVGLADLRPGGSPASP